MTEFIRTASVDIIQITSFVLLMMLCGEVVFRTALMTHRAVKKHWNEKE
jgi:hypothetical protein